MKLKLRVRNVGGSRAVFIPAAPAQAEGIEIGDIVVIEVRKERQ
jgi:antitoxin component of MazEF toxin-antitoxin module